MRKFEGRFQLVMPGAMPRLEGFSVPEEIYFVLTEPVLLAGMAEPGRRPPWAALACVGIRSVVCLSDASPSYDPEPLLLAHAVHLEDLHGGRIPTDPRGEARRLDAAVDVIVRRLSLGEGVVTHCVGGTGRTGTVLGGVLQSMGVALPSIKSYLDRLHRARGGSWPESPWQASYLASREARGKLL